MLEKLETKPGSVFKRKRVGRGEGSTLGKTCGKGQKGQKSRGRGKVPVGFEGGQMPLQRRLPKRGFNNIFRIEYSVVNICDIVESKRLDRSALIDVTALLEAGLVKRKDQPLKILGNGEIKEKIQVKADKFSQSAAKKIIDAGGQIETVEG